MIREVATLSINGELQKQLINDVCEIEVEEYVESADVFRVRISISVRKDGTWTHIDDPLLAIWNRIEIVGGYPADNATLIDGYITHVAVYLSGTGAEDSYLELTGMDGSARMDLEEKQLAWPNKKDSEIAKEIFKSYGLAWEVEDTQLQHAESVATTLQSETDIRFLRRLAARNGFECFVQGKKGFFRSPNLQAPPQKLLAIPNDLPSLRVEVDGTPPTALEVRRIDPLEKKENQEKLVDLPRRKLGKTPLKAAQSGIPNARRLIKQHPAAGTLEMQAELRSAYEAAAEFVTISGEFDSRTYRAVLHAKRLVTIKGLGPTHSGLYYVTRVRHHFTEEGDYLQSFEAYRNGLGLTGAESFATPPANLPILPGLGRAAAKSNREQPAQPSPATTGGGTP